MHECEAMVAAMARDHGVSLVLPTSEISCFVQVDRVRIKQVLINLLSNAIKYNRKGGTVTVNYVARSEGRISICVADTGAGLTAFEVTQLFQPFNRLKHAKSAKQGTGIGLVLCKRLVELMGGKIGVECTIGEGCMFWVELERAAPPLASAKTAQTIGSTSIGDVVHAQSLLSPRTLLYVEDNPANVKLVEAIIERQPDIRLLTAPNGKYGIEMARQFLPDFILMDIDLPDISGLKARQMLAVDPLTAHIPVIALSANAMPRDVKQGLEAGFIQYLTKPIKIDEFLKILGTFRV
jgi:CheY-like chemotaxis protein/anti-sigma regulatory factor (Ser/Thr protein kinase)